MVRTIMITVRINHDNGTNNTILVRIIMPTVRIIVTTVRIRLMLRLSGGTTPCVTHQKKLSPTWIHDRLCIKRSLALAPSRSASYRRGDGWAAGVGLAPVTFAPRWGSTLPASAPGLGSPPPHLRRDRAGLAIPC